MNIFVKYGLAFLAAVFGLCGLLVLIQLYLVDAHTLSPFMSNLGAFGGFLSGVGTIVLAAAAAYGVDSWIKQLKTAKHLEIVWKARCTAQKLYAAKCVWYKHDVLGNTKMATEALIRFDLLLDELEGDCCVLDQLCPINSEQGYHWHNKAIDIQLKASLVIGHLGQYGYFSKHPITPIRDALNLDLIRLSKDFDDSYNSLRKGLFQLEKNN